MAQSKLHKKAPVSGKTLLAIGAGVAALATASYYFFGPEGKEHRKKAQGWMIKLKGEIVEKLEDAKEVTEEVYNNAVDSVVAGYLENGKIGKKELQDFGNRLKSQWKQIAKSTQKKVAKKVAKK